MRGTCQEDRARAGAQGSEKLLEVISPTGVVVILPVLNEKENIDGMLTGIGRELADLPHRVCVIDDGSTDGTVEKIRAAMHDNPHLHLIQRKKTQRGSQRGSALKAGLEWGLHDPQLDVFVEMDGDLSHRVEELRTGIGMIVSGNWDMAVASKYVPGSRVLDRPFGRQVVSRVCSFIVGTVISSAIKDYSNGYRFYNRRAARLVVAHRIRYGSPIYLTEVLALWLRQGLRVVEFPSTYVGRHEGLSKLRLLDLFKAGLAVFEIGWRFHGKGFETVPDSVRLSLAPGDPPDQVGTRRAA